MEDNFKKLLEKRETALKKFVRKDKPYSNFINENFYTNQFILIIDPMFMRFSESDRVIEKKYEYSRFTEFEKVKKKISEYDYDNCSTKVFQKGVFKEFVKELKKMSMDQIKILPNGDFKLFDQYGYWKWNIQGHSDVFENINFECDNKLFQNVLNYFIATGHEEVTIKSNKDFMVITSDGGVKVFICSVLLAEFENNLWK